MRIIGLTGSIACGKSSVSSLLLSRRIPVIDGDRLSRELTLPGKPVLLEIRRLFGDAYFASDGSLNRRALGQLVFSNPEARNALDHLMAPYLEALTEQRLQEAASSGASLCILDMPLLYEKGYDRFCDTVWTVWLPFETQLSRLMTRDGFTREEALSRIQAVMSSDEKAARANRIIDNSGAPEDTVRIVSALLDEEISRANTPVRSRRSQRFSSDQPSVPASVSASDISVPDPPAAALPDIVVPKMAAPAAPEEMDRPESAKHRSNRSRAAWRMPVWIRAVLLSMVALLLVGIASLSLMKAYLRRQEDQHISEQKKIDQQYPLLYRDWIERYADEFNLSPAFVSAIIRNESSFQSHAESGVGARGLMQLMPDTAEWIAHKLGIEGYAFDRMFDPESNIHFGCWYLNYLSKLFLGDPVCVAAAYHAGQGQLKVWLSDPNLSTDGYTMPLANLPEGPTKNYAGRVTRDYGIYQEKYFSPSESDISADSSVF